MGLNIEIPEEEFPDEARRQEEDGPFDPPEHGVFESCHGARKLHYQKNLPPANVTLRAIMVWQHGMHIHGHSGNGMQCANETRRYRDMVLLRVRRMNARGIAVYANDPLGHGVSEGKWLTIPNGDWKINRYDLVRFARIAADGHPEGTPLILSGDSYGGCLALHAARVLQTEKCNTYFMPHPITSESAWKEAESQTHDTDRSNSHSNKPHPITPERALKKAEPQTYDIEPYSLEGSAGLIDAFCCCVSFPIHHHSDKELNVVSQLEAEDTVRHEIKWIEKQIEAKI